jgi:tetratricopeptide (TPR) repeat protein
VFLGLLVVNTAVAQYDIDSLKQVIQNPKLHDTIKLETIKAIVNNTYDTQESIKYNAQLGSIAQKNLANPKLSALLKKRYSQYLASYYSNLAVLQQEEGNPAATKTIEKAIALNRAINDEKELYATILTKGLLLYKEKKVKQAIACLYQARQYFEKHEAESLDDLWYVNLNLGTFHSEQEQNEKAIPFYKKAIYYFDKKKGALTLDDNIQKSIIYMNIGSSYIAIKQFDKAVTSLNQALQLARANDDGYRAALSLGRLGLIDMKYERFKAAEAKFTEAIALSDSPISKSYALVTLGKVYYYDNQKEKAIERLEEGLALSQSVGWNELVMDSAELLDVIYKEKGNYKKAYENSTLFNKLSDSSKVRDNRNELKQQELKYDYDKKVWTYKLATEKKNAAKNNLLIGLSALVVLLLIGAYFLYRNYKHKQTISSFEKKALQQKLLLTQMNPHFIFNSVDNIQSLIHDNRQQEAVKYLSSFSKLTRQILEHSTENYITLEEELTMLENYISIQQLLYNNKFTFSIETSNIEAPESILVPPMVAQPFIENAIKHGLKNKTTNGEIAIVFEMKDNKLLFEVQDNGSGFSSDLKPSNHKSVAIQLTKERLQSISNQDQFTVAMENRLDDDRNVIGAKVFFEIPYLYEN